MNYFRTTIAIACIALFFSSCAPTLTREASAVEDEEKKTELTLDRLYSWPHLWGTSPSSGVWSDDGKYFAFLWNTEGERFRDLYIIEPPDGQPVRLTDMKEFKPIPIEDDERTEDEKIDDDKYDGGIGRILWSADNRYIALVYRSDIYLIDVLERTEPLPLFRTAAEEKNIAFSDDGKYLSYKLGVNLMLRDMETGVIRQITNVTKPNQEISWYVWSPDSKKIWVDLADKSEQKEIVIPDYTPKYVKTKTVRRSFVGETVTTGKIGVVSIDGGLVNWMEDWEGKNYIYNLVWSPDGKQFLLSEVTRDYRNWKLHLVDAETLKRTTLVEETKERYFSIIMFVSSKGRHTRFFMSSRDGYNHIYSIPAEGGEPTQLTKGEWDVRDFSRPRDSEDLFYNSYELDPTWQASFRLSPDGKTKTRLSTQDGMSNAMISRDGKNVMLGYSTPVTPWEYYWVDAEHPDKMRRITHSPIDGFEDVPLVEPKHITFTNRADGKTIHGYIFIPPNLERGIRGHDGGFPGELWIRRGFPHGLLPRDRHR